MKWNRVIWATIVVILALLIGPLVEVLWLPLGFITGVGGGFLAMSILMGHFPWDVR